jgi:hypothetical protein
MPRKSKTDELREKFEVAIAKGLESDSAAERTQALRSAGDLLNPNLTDLQKQVKQAEDARTTAEASLAAVVAERDTLVAKIAELEPLASQLPGLAAELSTLTTANDEWRKEQTALLVEEAKQCKWDAERARNEAKETLKTAQAEFGARGQQILLDFIQKLVEQFSIPEPAPETLPAGISPLVLTLWGHSAVKAQIMLAYAKSFPEPSEAYRQTLVRCLKAQLPVYEGAPQSDPIEHLQDKIDVLRSLGKRWPGVLEEVGRRVEEAQIQRQADFLRTHYADLAAAQHASSLRGEGRTPISVEAPVSVTGYTGPHDPACCCGKPGCNPLPPHLRADTWLGTRPTEKVEDINARHEVDTTLDYGQQLIERENLAKRGKLVTVLPPESMAQSRTSLDDNEGEELLP